MHFTSNGQHLSAYTRRGSAGTTVRKRSHEMLAVCNQLFEQVPRREDVLPQLPVHPAARAQTQAIAPTSHIHANLSSLYLCKWPRRTTDGNEPHLVPATHIFSERGSGTRYVQREGTCQSFAEYL